MLTFVRNSWSGTWTGSKLPLMAHRNPACSPGLNPPSNRTREALHRRRSGTYPNRFRVSVHHVQFDDAVVRHGVHAVAGSATDLGPGNTLYATVPGGSWLRRRSSSVSPTRRTLTGWRSWIGAGRRSGTSAKREIRLRVDPAPRCPSVHQRYVPVRDNNDRLVVRLIKKLPDRLGVVGELTGGELQQARSPSRTLPRQGTLQ